MICGMLQACEFLRSAVVAAARRSWYASKALVRYAAHQESMSRAEFEECLVNLLVLVMLVVGAGWLLTRKTGHPVAVTESPASSWEGEPPADKGSTGPRIPDDSEAASRLHGR